MSTQFNLHTKQTFDSVSKFLHNCSQTKNLKSLKKIHASLITTGSLFLSPTIHSKIIDTYTICTNIDPSKTLPDFLNCLNPSNPLQFNSLISGFRRNNRSFLAVKTFTFMHMNGVCIDTYALCCALTACSDVESVGFGIQLHTHVARSGWMSSVFVGSALIDFYSKMLLIHDAREVFDEMPVRNTVCVNALLSGYVEAKLWNEGLELVRKMPILNFDFDNFTLSAALRACSGLFAIQLGKQVHAKLIHTVLCVEDDVFLQSSLIEMYGKCGLVEKAKQAFELAGFKLEREQKMDLVLWTSMLGVYGRNGHFSEVIRLYKDMLIEGVKPDEVAFVSIISACAHTGQIELGIEYFKSMVDDFGLNPRVEHYSCLIDLLCRGGEVDKVWNLVNEMSCRTNTDCSVSMWGALLSACNECGNVDMGILAAQKALQLDPKNVGVYVLLSNMYVRHGMWDEIEPLREMMRGKGLEKDVGCSWIEVTA